MGNAYRAVQILTSNQRKQEDVRNVLTRSINASNVQLTDPNVLNVRMALKRWSNMDKMSATWTALSPKEHIVTLMIKVTKFAQAAVEPSRIARCATQPTTVWFVNVVTTFKMENAPTNVNRILFREMEFAWNASIYNHSVHSAAVTPANANSATMALYSMLKVNVSVHAAKASTRAMANATNAVQTANLAQTTILATNARVDSKSTMATAIRI